MAFVKMGVDLEQSREDQVSAQVGRGEFLRLPTQRRAGLPDGSNLASVDQDIAFPPRFERGIGNTFRSAQGSREAGQGDASAAEKVH